MRMTTPNEFLQFAKEMGLGRIKSTSSSSSPSSSMSRSISNKENYTSTGLSVLNNLCRLIEQIHQLKAENHRLRAHLDLVEHVDQFQQHFLSKDKQKSLPGNKSYTLSPSNSSEIKRSLSNRERRGHNQEDSSLISANGHESNELIDSNSNSSSVPTWNKVRHALKFSLRRKQDSSTSPLLRHIERQVPTISISIESDDDQLHDKQYSKKKKRSATVTGNDSRPIIFGEETDQDDESSQLIRTYHKGRLDRNETPYSSSTERQETLSALNVSNADDEQLDRRKQSKIASYRRKIRSKLDTVKRQFSDQNLTSTIRRSHNSSSTTYDIGLGLNYTLLTAQLAPALTKSYQQKMREWETMQKSNFLVNYRRQSIIPKADLNSNSRTASITQISNEPSSADPTIPSSPVDFPSPIIEELEVEQKFPIVGPILSPNQRTLILHQWREIMSEEISLRHYNDYLQKKLIVLKELKTNLKSLKTNIFCTNHLIKQQSMNNLFETNQFDLLQRCRSLDSFIFMPVSWSLAVQSAAYSDILDGTSNKTTERAILLNKTFFDRLKHFKHDREKFEQESIQDLQLLNCFKLKPKTISTGSQLRARRVPMRGCLRKLSLISSSEFPQHFLPDAAIPLQTIIAHVQSSDNEELLPITTANEELISSNKQNNSKRTRFDLMKSFQRSRSMYLTQFHSWLQRRRQQQQQSSPVRRRKSAAEPKVSTPCSTPKLFGSPRLARLQQRIFKTSAPSSPQTHRTQVSNQILDDTDHRSPYELPVRIYFPPSSPPTARHVRINENLITTFDNDHDDPLTPIFDRKYASLSSSFRLSTAKERRESFASSSSSNIFNQRYF